MSKRGVNMGKKPKTSSHSRSPRAMKHVVSQPKMKSKSSLKLLDDEEFEDSRHYSKAPSTYPHPHYAAQHHPSYVFGQASPHHQNSPHQPLPPPHMSPYGGGGGGYGGVGYGGVGYGGGGGGYGMMNREAGDITSMSYAEINRMIHDLQDENIMLKRNVQNEQKLRVAIEQKCHEINEKMIESRQGLVSTKEALVKVQSAADQMMAKRDQREAQIKKLQTMVKLYEGRIVDLESQTADESGISPRDSQQMTKLKKVLIDREQELHKIEDDFNNATLELNSARRENKRLQEEKKDLQYSLDAAEKKIVAMDLKFKSIDVKNQARIDKLEAEKKSNSNPEVISKLVESKVAAIIEQSVKRPNSDLESKLEAMMEERKALDARVKDMEQQQKNMPFAMFPGMSMPQMGASFNAGHVQNAGAAGMGNPAVAASSMPGQSPMTSNWGTSGYGFLDTNAAQAQYKPPSQGGVPNVTPMFSPQGPVRSDSNSSMQQTAFMQSNKGTESTKKKKKKVTMNLPEDSLATVNEKEEELRKQQQELAQQQHEFEIKKKQMELVQQQEQLQKQREEFDSKQKELAAPAASKARNGTENRPETGSRETSPVASASEKRRSRQPKNTSGGGMDAAATRLEALQLLEEATQPPHATAAATVAPPTSAGSNTTGGSRQGPRNGAFSPITFMASEKNAGTKNSPASADRDEIETTDDKGNTVSVKNASLAKKIETLKQEIAELSTVNKNIKIKINAFTEDFVAANGRKPGKDDRKAEASQLFSDYHTISRDLKKKVKLMVKLQSVFAQGNTGVSDKGVGNFLNTLSKSTKESAMNDSGSSDED